MSSDVDGPASTRIALRYRDGRWIARDEDSGTTATGETRRAALDALDEAVDDEPDGIDPDDPFWTAEPVAAGGPTDVSENADRYLYGTDGTTE